MTSLANPHAENLRSVRTEWGRMLTEVAPSRVADLFGYPCSTITRRNEKDDQMASYPLTDGLVMIRELAKPCPTLLQVAVQFLTRTSAHQTLSLNAVGRADHAIGLLATTITEINQAAHGPDSPERFTPAEVRDLRRRWATTLHAMNRFLASAEAESKSA